MYTQHGELEGIKWLSEYKGGRTFLLHVGHLEQEYECDYEPRFGVDASDYVAMNEIMDQMHQTVLSGEVTSNYNIEQKIKKMDEQKKMTRISLHEDLKDRDKIREIEKTDYYANTDDTDSVSSLMYQFSAGYINYKEMVEQIDKQLNPANNLKVNFPSDYNFMNPKGVN